MKQNLIDQSCRARFEITLSDGRAIWMNRLLQWQTYGGLLEGHPGPKANAAIVQMARAEVESCFGADFPVTLIQPESGLYDFSVIGTDETVSYEVLPAITCGALFDSDSTCGDECAYSSAVIMWFQDEWGPPIPSVTKRFVELDWGEIACDWSP